ncbi:MAG: hypothetical protein U0793_22070 [Gemmataceae bacterium]
MFGSFLDRRSVLSLLLVLLFLGRPSLAGETKDVAPPKGQRVFSAGHSFHYFMPPILRDIALKAGVKDHEQVGLSAIGGSRVIQHWDKAEDKNEAKKALKTGKVDVFTMSPIHLPDPGIDHFVTLALENNPKVRILVQEFWLPFDIYDTTFKVRPKSVDHDAAKLDELRSLHKKYFADMDAHVRELNKKHGKEAVFVTPVGQAVLTLREKIVAGEVPGLKKQSDLFTDPIGHAKPPLQALVAYCHYAVIYQRSPVGIDVPAVLSKSADAKALNRLLQEIAWEAVTRHPLSGVSGVKK